MKATRRKPGRPDEPANVDYWRASTEATLARFEQLRARDVSRAELVKAWAPVVELVKRETKRWPALLASRCASITDPEIARLAPCSDGPRVESPRPSDEALARMETTLEEWRASRPVAPEPFLYPLYEPFAETVLKSAQLRAFARALAPRKPGALPPAPTTSIEARLAYRRASAKLKRHKIAAQAGDYVHRADARSRMENAVLKFRSYWFDLFRSNVSQLCGDRAKALAFVTRLRGEAIESLATLYEPRRRARPKRRIA